MRASPPALSEHYIEQERHDIAQNYLPKLETTIADLGYVAGFICRKGRDICALFVHPDAQGRGIGTALLGAQTPPLALEVFAENHRAREFYARRGFREAGKRTHDQTGDQLYCLALDERG